MAGRIYTRTGDQGKTGLVGGSRVGKDDIRIEAVGSVDEANCFIGLLRSKLETEHVWQEGLHRIQRELMDLMSHLATPPESKRKPTMSLPEGSAAWAESWMDEIEERLASASEYFLLPGGNEISALCHVCRTQLRRAERRVVALHQVEPVPACILTYINRLSDLFFKLSREALEEAGVAEERWNLFRYRGKAQKQEDKAEDAQPGGGADQSKGSS